MIYADYIREWQQYAPWPLLRQIEQDLVISRALVELYQHPVIASSLAFRGGTALHKLFLNPPMRYSEDLDFVQIKAEPIGKTFRAIKEVLEPWLGEPKWDKKHGRVTLNYRFLPEDEIFPMKLKLEINTAEHFSVYGFAHREFLVNSRWFTGQSKICTYSLNELVGTKLRALYQRKKGRDLFDIWVVLEKNQIDLDKVIHAFRQYLSYENKTITRAQFESNLIDKLNDLTFKNDIKPLILDGSTWDMEKAMGSVMKNILPLLTGETWKKTKTLFPMLQ